MSIAASSHRRKQSTSAAAAIPREPGCGPSPQRDREGCALVSSERSHLAGSVGSSRAPCRRTPRQRNQRSRRCAADARLREWCAGRKPRSVRQISASVAGSSAVVASSSTSRSGECNKRTRNRETLALTAGQGRSAFADLRLATPAASLRRNRAPRRSLRARRTSSSRGSVAAENDICAHGVVEQHQFLRHVTDMVSPRREISFRKIDAVNQHTARGRRHKAEHRIDQRGLAAAGRADEGAERARRIDSRRSRPPPGHHSRGRRCRTAAPGATGLRACPNSASLRRGSAAAFPRSMHRCSPSARTVC